MKIFKSSITKPPRIILYGGHGVGKSTFAANCPAPIFIRTEDGADALGVETFDLCKEWSDMTNQIMYLTMNDHPYKTVVIDSLDWAEKLAFAKVCEQNKVDSIDKMPYGRGYTAAEALWADALDSLTYLNTKKKMLVVLLAHSQIKRFEDPERESYDRYELDLQRKSAALLAEWSDILALATYSMTVISKDGGFGQKITKASSSGERIMYLEERPGHNCKNRYGLPHELPLSWAALAAELKQHATKDKQNG